FIEKLVATNLLLASLDNDVVGIVDNRFEITKREVEKVPHGARERLEEPDVRNGHSQLDVSHAVAAHLAERDFHAATVADHSAITDALVLAAMALPVLHGTEDALAEESILFRLERPVVDGLRLGYLAP